MLALIADDERSQRILLKRLLDQLGVRSIEVENGIELLTKMEEERPDLVVIDYDMPLMNGAEALQAIRESDRFRDLPVVCVSSVTTVEHVKALIGLGLSDYLVKPLRVEAVLPRLRDVLRRAAGERSPDADAAGTGLLLVDGDSEFLAFAGPLLAGDAEVVQADSGVRAVTAYQNHNPPPNVVLVGEGLSFLREEQLAETLRRAAAARGIAAPRVFLMTGTTDVDAAKTARFDGVVQKSLVPDQFVAEFRRVVRRESPGEVPADR